MFYDIFLLFNIVFRYLFIRLGFRYVKLLLILKILCSYRSKKIYVLRIKLSCEKILHCKFYGKKNKTNNIINLCLKSTPKYQNIFKLFSLVLHVNCRIKNDYSLPPLMNPTQMSFFFLFFIESFWSNKL